MAFSTPYKAARRRRDKFRRPARRAADTMAITLASSLHVDSRGKSASIEFHAFPRMAAEMIGDATTPARVMPLSLASI